MKTATITYHNVYNYGALLQVYALQQVQLRMSIDNVIIDFSSEKNKIYKKLKGKSFKILIINIIRLLDTLLNIIPIKKRIKNFEKFTNQKLHLTRKYLSLKDLRDNPPEADLYIAGSDQLWNVSEIMRREFFLDFGDQNVKRVSYAVSMGSYKVPFQYEMEMYKLISKFDFISVREIEAKEFVEKLLSKKEFVRHDIDPVFLLSQKDWTIFSKEWKINSKYILCIPMSGHPLMNAALKKLKQLTGYCVVTITTDVFTRINGDVYKKDATVEEFVYLMKNAEFILTTSFHGTAFSTIFNKKFYSFIGGLSPTRITGLLNRFGLEKRIAKSIEDITLEEIDFTNTNEIIEQDKKAAIEYMASLSDYINDERNDEKNDEKKNENIT